MNAMTAENQMIEVSCIVTGKLEVNTFFITDSTDVIIIDPGGDPEVIIEEARKYENILVLLTHNHYDHSGATNEILSALPNSRLAAHAECIRLAGDKDKNLCQFLMNLDYALTHKPAFTISNNEIFNQGSIEVKALHTTGHSLGHLCYWLKSERALFCGDMLTAVDIGRHDVPGSDLDAMIEDCKDLLEEIPDDTLIYPGHGPALTAREVKETNPHLKKFYQ